MFYKQFGLTMAIAIGFSAVNALTLSPALCAVFLKAHDDKSSLKERMGTAYGEAAETMKKRYSSAFKLNLPPLVTALFLVATITFMVLGWYSTESIWKLVVASICAIVTIMGIFSSRFHAGFEIGYNRLLKLYNSVTKFFVSHKITSFAIVGGSIAILVWLMNSTPSALVPNEDTEQYSVWSTCPGHITGAHRRGSRPSRRHYRLDTRRSVTYNDRRLQLHRRTGCNLRYIHHQAEELEPAFKIRKL